MYASVWNHFFQFSHYALAFLVLYVGYPQYIFRLDYESRLDTIASNYLRMVFIIICAGYFLVFLKVFEFLGLLMFFTALGIYSFIMRHSEEKAKNILVKLNACMLDLADSLIKPSKLLKSLVNIRKRNNGRRGKNSYSIGNLSEFILIAAVFAYTVYLRFYDAYYFAAPAMSDGNVTLAWIKYIIQRKLFTDGIYPQGFYMNMAVIQKFTFINPLYVVRYSGPLNGVLITAGIFFFICRCTGRRLPALVGAALYGMFGQSLSLEWMRQAATNSQEYGYVLVLPVLYFALRYIEKDDRYSFWTYFSGVSALGLIHSISYAFAVVGVLVLALLAVVTDFKSNIGKVMKMGAAGAASGVIAAIPLCIGLLLGRSFHSSSAEYLTSTVTNAYFPTLDNFDYAAIYALLLLAIYTLINIRKVRKHMAEAYVTCLAGTAFLIFYYGGAVTHSQVIINRAPDLWILLTTVVLGMSMFVLLKPIKNSKVLKAVEVVLVCLVLVLGTVNLKPQPILTYKMERNEEVEQYLKISKTYSPTLWMLVANFEGAYAEVLGTGTHIRLEDFIAEYKPYEQVLLYMGTNQVIPDLFIYHDKKMFSTQFENKKKEYEDRKTYNEEIANWIQRYKDTHPGGITLFYADENFEIYHIHQLQTQDNILSRIWNSEGANR